MFSSIWKVKISKKVKFVVQYMGGLTPWIVSKDNLLSFYTYDGAVSARGMRHEGDV